MASFWQLRMANFWQQEGPANGNKNGQLAEQRKGYFLGFKNRLSVLEPIAFSGQVYQFAVKE